MKDGVRILIFFMLVAFFCTNVGSCLKNTGLPEGFLVVVLFIGAMLFASFVLFKGEEVITNTVEKIDNSIKEETERKEVQKIVNKEVEDYKKSKNSFSFFSDEKLFELYQKFQKENKEDTEMLSLEEELIRRGIIDHSTMHEKLYHLRKMLDNTK